MQVRKEHQIHFWYVVAALLAVLLIQNLIALVPSTEISYNEFQTLLAEHKVKDLVIGTHEITGSYVQKPEGKPDQFTTFRVDPELAHQFEKAGVTYSGQPGPGPLATLLAWVVPVAAFVLLWMFLVRPMAGGAGGLMAVGQSKARIYVENEVKVTFADVAGVDEAKEELKEIVTFLKDPERYGRLGAHIPRGILLVGPAGHRQDPARPCRGGRGGGAVLLHLRLGIRRDVRGRRRRAGARPVPESARAGPGDHLHRRARRAGRACAAAACCKAATTRRSRR